MPQGEGGAVPLPASVALVEALAVTDGEAMAEALPEGQAVPVCEGSGEGVPSS